MICVTALGGNMGLKAGNSVPDGGCNFTFIDWESNMKLCVKISNHIHKCPTYTTLNEPPQFKTSDSKLNQA